LSPSWLVDGVCVYEYTVGKRVSGVQSIALLLL